MKHVGAALEIMLGGDGPTEPVVLEERPSIAVAARRQPADLVGARIYALIRTPSASTACNVSTATYRDQGPGDAHDLG
jgi:hypothetical protein